MKLASQAVLHCVVSANRDDQYAVEGALTKCALEAANEQYESLQAARQQPYSLDDALVTRTIKAFTDQRDDFWLFDEQLTRWKAQKLTHKQQTEIQRLQSQMEKLREMNTAILSLAEELQEVTIERLLAKDDAEVGLEFLLGTLGKPKKKPAR